MHLWSASAGLLRCATRVTPIDPRAPTSNQIYSAEYPSTYNIVTTITSTLHCRRLLFPFQVPPLGSPHVHLSQKNFLVLLRVTTGAARPPNDGQSSPPSGDRPSLSEEMGWQLFACVTACDRSRKPRSYELQRQVSYNGRTRTPPPLSRLSSPSKLVLAFSLTFSSSTT
jgi:hypothetical protein